MNAREIADVIAEYLVNEKDLAIAMIKNNDKEELADEIYDELTEIQKNLMEEKAMKEELLKIAQESLSSDEVSEIVKEKFMNAVGDAIENAFRWGNVRKPLRKRQKKS